MRAISSTSLRLTGCVLAFLMCSAGTQKMAEPFAPGVVSTPHHGCISFTSDGNTAYFTEHEPSPDHIMVSHFEDNAWGTPQRLPFSRADSGRTYDYDPAISPDGSRLFFASKKGEQTQIWSALRQGEGWSEAKPVADGLCGPSVASDGTLYFCGKQNDTRGGTDIYRSRLVNGAYAAPENLGDTINSAADEWDAFIAPDQSYLIFTRVISPGHTVFYLSRRNGERWSALRAVDIPEPAMKVCPVVSPDGKSFFFTSGGIFRTDAAVLPQGR